MDFKKNLELYGNVEENVSLAKLTTFRVGGSCRYLVHIDSVEHLAGCLNYLEKTNLKWKLLGKGSNVLFSDNFYDGVIVKLDSYLNKYWVNGTTVNVLAGCSLIQLAYEMAKLNLAGLEFASGIPGTIGGATAMNAGAYLVEMKDIITRVKIFKDGNFTWLEQKECNFGYRDSIFLHNKNWIIVEVELKLKNGLETEIMETMKLRKERRLTSQPLDKPSAGSTFVNPKGYHAWELIEKCGLRGMCYGGAKVSEKHCNFIINDNNATASDIKILIELVQKRVYESFQIELKTEVEFINW